MDIRSQLNLSIKPSQKQITNFISEIQQQPHQQKQYKKLLEIKQQLQKQEQSLLTIQQIDKTLHPVILTTKKLTSNDTNLCFCCYQQIKNKTVWCKICGNVVCKSCLTRIRQLQNEEIVKFCDTCDKKFIEALILRGYLKQKKLYSKAFQTLISQQQTLQNLLSIEKIKLCKVEITGPKKKIYEKLSQIQQLTHKKKQLAEQNIEMKSKIDWGKSITLSLKKKQRNLRKLQQKSFGQSSSINQQQMDNYVPKAESQLNLDIQNINQSFVGSKQQNQEDPEWMSNDRRTCQTCALI